MKKITVPVVLAASVLISQSLHPQSQLRFKPGVSYTSYKLNGIGISSVVLGGEYSRPLKNKKGAWHIGVALEKSYNHPIPNGRYVIPNNLTQSSQPGIRIGAGAAKTVAYAGFERFIGRDTSKPHKNYFSVIGGLGLAFTLSGRDRQYALPEKFMTHNGGTIEGYTSTKNTFPVAPYAYAGIRYNVTNKKGITVLIIELVASYGAGSCYHQTIDYTLNTASRRNVVNQNGFSVQLNVIVPLFTFSKKAAHK